MFDISHFSHIIRALIRPGRFDSQINIPLPDVKARFEILKVHSLKVKMDNGKITCLGTIS